MALPNVFESLEKEMYTPRETEKIRFADDFEGLITDSADLLQTMVMHSSRPVDDATLRKVTANQINRFYRERAFSPSVEEFSERAESLYQRLSAGVSRKSQDLYGAAKEAAKHGGLTFPSDVVLSEEQRKRIDAGIPWNWEPIQLKGSYLRKDLIPEEDISAFALSSPDKIISNPAIPEAIRMRFQEDLAAEQVGAPVREKTGIDATGWAVPFDMALKVLGAPSEMMAGMTSSRLRQLRGLGMLDQVVRNQAPTLGQIKALDESRKPIDPEDLPWSTQMALAIGVPITGGEHGIGRRPLVGETENAARAYGIPVEEFERKYQPGVSLMKQLKNMGRGLIYDKDRGSIAKEFSYLRGAYSIAAKRALSEMSSDDERWSRYYGMSYEERWKEAEERAKEQLGKEATDNAKVKELAAYLYEHIPQEKMLRDMIELDSAHLGIDDPEMAEMMHKIIVDPLWLGAGIKTIVGGARLVGHGARLALGPGASKVAGEAIVKTVAPIAAAKDRAFEPINKMFRHLTTYSKEFDDFDSMAEAQGALGRSVETVVDSSLARSAARATEAQAMGDVQKLKNAAKEIDDIFAEIPESPGRATEFLFGKGSATTNREALGKVLRGDVTLDATTAESRRLIQHLVGESEHTQRVKAWVQAGKKGAPPAAPASRLDPVEMMDLLASEAVRTRHLPAKYASLPGRIRAASDKFEKIARETGQLTRINKGIVEQARYVNFFVPRYLQFTDEIHGAVVKAGFKDIGEAAMALHPPQLPEALKQLRDIGYKGSDEQVIRQAADSITSARQTGKQGQLGLLDANVSRAIEDTSKARSVIPTQYWDDIRNLRDVTLDTDFLGANGLHRLNAVTRSAQERTPIGKLYPWLKDAQRQYEVYTKSVIAKAGKSAEVKHLGEAFGVNNVAGTLGSASMVKISRKGLGSARQGVSSEARIARTEKILTDKVGLEMVALDFGTSRRVAQTLLPKGAKVGDDAIVFAPKAIASRYEALYPIVGPKGAEDLTGVFAKFRDYVVRPMNAIYRPTRTLLRSPAFYALNYFGAVGLGALAHGVRALNPALQIGAHRAAWMAAFGGSKKALDTKFVLKSGHEWTIGEAIALGEKYGILQQGTMKYALDVGKGKGPLAWYGKQLHKLAGVTRAQQVANFGDNYQKFVAMLGHIKDPNNVRDVYRTLDFVTEYAGNYNMLTKFEKTTMRDVFMFYSWNRFILPHLATQIVKNPNRLQAFERMRSVMEYNLRHQAPGTGLGVPGWLQMQRAFTAPGAMQPKPGEAAPHEFAVGVIESPLASMSVLAGGFHGESPIHAQLGPLGWVLINTLTGFDNTTGHAWQKPYTMPGPESFKNTEGFKDWLYNFNDTKIGREVVETTPFGGAMMNIIKLYGDHGMHNEQAELWMRLRAGRDFFGLDNLVAKMVGGTPLSIPGQFSYGGIDIPAPFIRGYAVRPLSTARREQRKALKKAFKGER